jgi:hypothetical protein
MQTLMLNFWVIILLFLHYFGISFCIFVCIKQFSLFWQWNIFTVKVSWNIFSRNHEFVKNQETPKNTKGTKNPIPRENQEFGIGFLGFFGFFWFLLGGHPPIQDVIGTTAGVVVKTFYQNHSSQFAIWYATLFANFIVLYVIDMNFIKLPFKVLPSLFVPFALLH